jgi:hypothetical protein
MALTWIFAICLLNAQGQCSAYIPQTNFSHLPVEDARKRCADMLKEFGVGDRSTGRINVCVRAYQFDETQGQYK